MVKSIEVQKKSGTYSDALVAIGIADLITDILSKQTNKAESKIQDMGHIYLIQLIEELTEEDLAQWEPNAGYKYIKFKDPDPLAPQLYFDYEEQREIEKQYREFSKSMEGNRKNKDKMLQDLQDSGSPIQTPQNILPLMKTLNGMRMGSNTLGQMHVAIREAPENFKVIVGMKLGLSVVQNKLDEKPYAKAASTLQLFNPTSGKGIHRAKPDGAGLTGFPEKLTDWFEEWMKFRAFTKAMLTYTTGTGGKDTKVLVLAPKDIGPSALSKVHHALLENRLYGSMHIDIFATLLLTETVINHSEVIQGHPTGIRLRGRTPKHIIAGFYQTYFKNLGTASAVMNVSFLGMPAWFPVTSRSAAEEWFEIIHEHRRCLQSLDESHSDDVPILMAYRTFLSTGDYMDALDFFARYAAHFMRKKSRNEWAEQFSTLNMGRVFMSEVNIQEIVQDEGFEHLADAIRNATVNQQIAKGIKGKSDYEIQYGLAQEWKRKVHNKMEFIMILSEFVQRYNSENAKRIEQGHKSRRNITENDLDRVIALIEKTKNPKLVGLLLLAYGYAKASKADDNPATIEIVDTEEGGN